MTTERNTAIKEREVRKEHEQYIKHSISYDFTWNSVNGPIRCTKVDRRNQVELVVGATPALGTDCTDPRNLFGSRVTGPDF